MLLVEKKLPGAEPVYYINDITGNTVFSQDGNLRKGNRWNFSIPDRFGRTAVEGLCDAPDAAAVEGMFVRVAKTDYANAASSICGTGYCSNIVLQAPSLLTADYYDDYRFLTLRQFEGLNRMGSRNARGLKTGTMTAILEPVYTPVSADNLKAEPSKICSVVSYDNEDRIACVETSNILGGKDRTVTEYTFSGKPLSMAVTHTAAGKLTAEESYGYTYDALDRPLQTRYSINNGQSVTLADNRYDELGRLQSDRRNGSASLATEYSYNLHGMPTRISTPLYTESLFYEQQHNGSTPQYGGNISAIDWSVADESDTYGKRGYTFSYDGMSRLTAAGYLENGKLNNHFSTSYKYDLMGNILTLRREGLLDSGDYGTIDDLTYSYEGNQVVKIDDAADESPSYSGAMHFRDASNEETEYTYDANGNMLTDSNKGITSIDYNVLDLPQCIKTKPRIIFKESTGNTIYYTYSADGTKLRATYMEADSRTMPYKPNALYNNNTGINIKTSGMVTPSVKPLESNYHYCSNLVYNNDRLSAILFDGGYASVDEGGGIVMHFYVKDHLGSNRLVVDGNGNIEEVNHYYPFGALMGDRCGVSRNKYKYIGKELDTMYGWNMQDHEARWYDPVLGRWMATDPLQEKYASFSTYYYANNNPLVFIDFNGKDGVRIVDEDNKTLTIKADYFVITAAQQYCDNNIINVFKGYSSKDIEKMNSYNEYLNNLKLIVPAGEYKGYSILFDLSFFDAGNVLEASIKASEDIYEGNSIGNTMRLGNEIIYKRLIQMPNYQLAKETIVTSDIDEDLICLIGMNRKSRSYDKPYYKLYENIKNIFIDGGNDYESLLKSAKEINQKPGILWRNLIFKTTNIGVIRKHGASSINNQCPFLNCKSEQDLKETFFKYLHVFKAKATLSDYFDLNKIIPYFLNF